MGDALALARDGPKAKKFFAWVHLYDPHTPYEPPEPYASRYASAPYLGEIAYTDAVVGRLTAWLRDRGLLERTLVVLTADHGESLGDHGEAAHAYFIYGATTHVPLHRAHALGPPRPQRRAGLGRRPHADRARSASAFRRSRAIDGRSRRARALRSGRRPRPRRLFGDLLPALPLRLAAPARPARRALQLIDAPEPELYDLAARSGRDQEHLQGQQRAGPRTFGCAWRRWPKRPGTAAPERQSLDPDTLQRLAALGYVGNVDRRRSRRGPARPQGQAAAVRDDERGEGARAGGALEDAIAKHAAGGRRGPEDHGRAPDARELAGQRPRPRRGGDRRVQGSALAQARRRDRARQPGPALPRARTHAGRAGRAGGVPQPRCA